MKILILGHKEHGKTTTAEYIQNKFRLNYLDSSMVAAKLFIFDALKDRYGYKTFEECYKDRRNHRAEWYNLILGYNINDKTKLATEILKEVDMYAGMRDFNEIQACKDKNLFDIIIGIYDPRKPLEASNSFNINMFKESDIIIYNNDDLETLYNRIDNLFKNFKI